MISRTSRSYAVAALVILAGAAAGFLVAGRTSDLDDLEEAARSLIPPGAGVESVSRNTGEALIVGAPSVTLTAHATEGALVEAARSRGWEIGGRKVHPGGIRIEATGGGLRADIVVLSSDEARVEVEDAPPPPVERLGLTAAGALLAFATVAAVRRVMLRRASSR